MVSRHDRGPDDDHRPDDVSESAGATDRHFRADRVCWNRDVYDRANCVGPWPAEACAAGGAETGASFPCGSVDFSNGVYGSRGRVFEGQIFLAKLLKQFLALRALNTPDESGS